jgi:hypothetical protein
MAPGRLLVIGPAAFPFVRFHVSGSREEMLRLFDNPF